MGLSRDVTARQIVGLAEAPVSNAAIEQVRVRVLPDGRLSREDAASYIGCAPKTLAMWASQGKGPAFVKVAGKAFYFLESLDRFIVEGRAGV